MFVFQKANQFVNIIFCEFQSIFHVKLGLFSSPKKNATLQTLFPYWKIAIFGRIAPTSSSHRLKSSPYKKNATLQTLFPYWKIAIFGRIAPRIRRIVPS